VCWVGVLQLQGPLSLECMQVWLCFDSCLSHTAAAVCASCDGFVSLTGLNCSHYSTLVPLPCGSRLRWLPLYDGCVCVWCLPLPANHTLVPCKGATHPGLAAQCLACRGLFAAAAAVVWGVRSRPVRRRALWVMRLELWLFGCVFVLVVLV
jgi:hypothetical protein